jgi:hypothetical protein
VTLSRRDFLLRSAALGAGALLFPHPLERAMSGLAWADTAPSVPRGLHLSYAGADTSSMTAMWFTNGASTPGSRIRWAALPAGADPATVELTNEAAATTSTTPGVDAQTHEATMTALAASSSVVYQVGNDVSWSSRRITRVAPAGRSPLRIVAFGDHATNEISRHTTLSSLAQEPHVVLVAGDVSYANGRQSVWDTYFDELEPLGSTVPIMPALGNHDSEDAEDGGFGFETYRNRFALPGAELHYSFDVGNVHVLSLEAGEAIVDPAVLADELAFAASDLASAAARRAAGEIDFVVVLQHFPLWSNHESRGNDETLVAAQEPLFQSFQIDLLVVGHNHMYERSKPMVYGNATSTALTGYGPDRVGYVEVLTGGGGAGLYDFVPDDEIQSWTAAHARRHNITVFDVDGPSMRVRALATCGEPTPASPEGDLLPIDELEVIDDFTLSARSTLSQSVPTAPLSVPLARR